MRKTKTRKKGLSKKQSVDICMVELAKYLSAVAKKSKVKDEKEFSYYMYLTINILLKRVILHDGKFVAFGMCVDAFK